MILLWNQLYILTHPVLLGCDSDSRICRMIRRLQLHIPHSLEIINSHANKHSNYGYCLGHHHSLQYYPVSKLITNQSIGYFIALKAFRYPTLCESLLSKAQQYFQQHQLNSSYLRVFCFMLIDHEKKTSTPQTSYQPS